MSISDDRPTLQQLASSLGIGLECRRCGCRDFRVKRTRPKPGFIMRRRICRHCGKEITTVERER